MPACPPLRAKTQRTAHRHTGSDGDLARAGGRTDKMGGCDALPGRAMAGRARMPSSGTEQQRSRRCTQREGTILNRAPPPPFFSDAFGQGAKQLSLRRQADGLKD
jgi:hypothetical protein